MTAAIWWKTAFLMMGLIAARQYFAEDPALGARITALFEGVEWDWYRRGETLLYWHWSPRHGWAMNHAIRGWNETLIVYVLAAGAARHAIDAEVYEQGFCAGEDYRNGKTYRGVTLPLGPEGGGPLFFAHYSFCGLDRAGSPTPMPITGGRTWRKWRSTATIALPIRAASKAMDRPVGGLTASDDPSGYDAHAPNNDNGTISPTASLSSFPYAPQAAMRALRHFLSTHGDTVWGRFGFTDAFNETRDWWADTFLAIDQGPIIVMMENYRSGLLWEALHGGAGSAARPAAAGLYGSGS